jgi:ribosomal-protein-alanine N-acetyltransferase
VKDAKSKIAEPKAAARKAKAPAAKRAPDGKPGRVYLEPVSPLRKAEFLRLARASKRFHKGWVSPPATEKRFAAYMARIGNGTYRCYYLCRGEDGALVGILNISQIFMGDFRSAYLGYYVFAPYARNRYMTEGLALLLREAFRTWKLHRVEANIRPENAPSKRLAERLGFRLEGYSPRYLRVDGKWRDHERWAITKEDWVKRKPAFL